MMQRGRSTRRGFFRDNKQHEGYVEYYSFSSRTWSRFMMTLDDKVLYLTFVDRAGLRALYKSINLDDETLINEYPGSYAFELITSSATEGQQRHIFQFMNENERDLWKAFILGVTTGVVPEDVKLLPGQLIDIRETVRNARPNPPPRRTILPQSGITSGLYAEPAGGSDLITAPPLAPIVAEPSMTSSAEALTSDVDNDVDDRDAATSGDHVDSSATCRLMRRTSELNNKILATQSKKSTFSPSTQPPPQQQQQQQQQLQPFSIIPPCPHQFSPSSPPSCFHQQPMTGTGYQPSEGHLLHMRQSMPPTGYQPNDSHVTLEQLIMQTKSRHMNNNEFHPFYMEPEKNRIPPSWFVDCDRAKAEVILTLGAQYGNVLMRPSTANSVTGKYVITMRTDTTGGSHLSHYAVVRGFNGFRIDVDNEQQSMFCLADAMAFFVRAVGPTFARPLRPIIVGSVRSPAAAGGGLAARTRATLSAMPSMFGAAGPAGAVYNGYSPGGRTVMVLNRQHSAAELTRRPSAALFIAPDSSFNVERLSLNDSSSSQQQQQLQLQLQDDVSRFNELSTTTNTTTTTAITTSTDDNK